MQAVTDFTATRAHIAYAVGVFRDGLTLEIERFERLKMEWVDRKIENAWFNKNRDFWTRYVNGGVKGEDGIGSYCTLLNISNQTHKSWYEARLEDATQLLQKFDCAVDTCIASTLYLSDKDLTLLSVSLQSAKR